MMMHAQSSSVVSAAPFLASESIPAPSSTRTSPSFATVQQPHNKRQRYSSRSNSVSGSSVTTVQRAQSPVDTTLASLRQGNGSATQSSFAHTRSPTSDHNDSYGEQMNRWSRSTDSSMSSAKRHQRATSSNMLGIASSEPLSSPRRPSELGLEQSQRILPSQPNPRPASRQRPMSPIDHSDRSWATPRRPGSRGNPLNSLPALQTKALRTDAESDSPSTASTGIVATSGSITPSAHSSYAPESFSAMNASPRSVVKSSRPSTARTSTAPMMSLNYSRLPKAEDVKESAHIRRRSEHLLNMERDSHLLRPSTAHPTSSNDDRRDRPKPKDRSEREKKAMLAKALDKANTAVVLDNKQNFTGALEAYNDACMLLQQVMDRSVNPADQRKLEAIKVTYTNRIEELKLLRLTQVDTNGGKGLPERPESNDSYGVSSAGAMTSEVGFPQESDSALFDATQNGARMADIPHLSYLESDQGDFFSRTMADVERVALAQENAGKSADISTSSKPTLHSSTSNERVHIINQRVSKLPPPEETRYLPAPLTTKKQPSPITPVFPESVSEEPHDTRLVSQVHESTDSKDPAGSNLWLDTIDESSASSVRSSVHSISSQSGMRRKPLQGHDVQGNADLDAAFDAAVEAAYDEGFEPDLDTSRPTAIQSGMVGHLKAPPDADIKEILSPTADTFARRIPHVRTVEDDEEERILDEFSHDYGHGFNFAFGTKSALPRQSDSSGYSRSTWQSSQTSERATAGTSLSTVAENDLGSRTIAGAKPPLPNVSPVSPVNVDNLPPSVPPPIAALPTPPKPEQLSGSTVRNRRFSGQNARELKIETSAEQNGRKRASTLHNPQQAYPMSDEYDTDTHKEVSIGAPLEASPSDAHHEHMLKSPPSLDLLASSQLALTPIDTIHSADEANMGGRMQNRPTLIRKNQSSLSLRADHAVLLPSPGLHELADVTPMSATFTVHKSKFERDPLSLQRAALQTFSSPAINASTSAGSYLFDTQLLANRGAYSPRSPGRGSAGLEPCPESLLLRPFWLMRSLATTITHDRGGYVTNKLFVPREVWQTRGVKLKSLDDKIANCDLLTAALGQLAEVDTFDADAVMDELQRFEEVMERVQVVLAKKLGSEVGVQGVVTLFKDAPPPGTHSAFPGETDRGVDTLSGSTDKNAKSHSSKGYLSSWRKLRSKSSGTPSGHAGAANHNTLKNIVAPGDRDANSMASVPMTTYVPVERRGQKRDLRGVSFDGPNREYMGSLARLFQSAQVLDQIARQVEDPGLKHSSLTHVGLELSIRHAAEFFSFYICRFVMADLGILVDKFIKRGTEWVVA